MANIKAKHVDIHPSVKIGKNVNIKCESIKLGEFCIIGDNVTIECRNFEAHSWLFMWHGVEVGRGGCNGLIQMSRLARELVYLRILLSIHQNPWR